MKETIKERVREIGETNALSLKGEIVIFGSTYMANFPFYELINRWQIESAVYNRSLDGLTIEEALEVLQVCVLDIKPSKVFLAFGEREENHLKAVEKYKTIVHRIQRELRNTKIYLLGLPNKNLQAFNEEIEKICDGKKVVYIPLAVNVEGKEEVYKTQFKQLTCFFRDKPLNMAEAFAMANF